MQKRLKNQAPYQRIFPAQNSRQTKQCFEQNPAEKKFQVNEGQNALNTLYKLGNKADIKLTVTV